MALIYLLPVLTVIFLMAALYYFIERDAIRYRQAIAQRLQEIARERPADRHTAC